MVIKNGIGYTWDVKFVDRYYMPTETAFATLKEVYKSVKDYNIPLECVRITKIGVEDDDWDFLEDVKEATETYFEKEEEEEEN